MKFLGNLLGYAVYYFMGALFQIGEWLGFKDRCKICGKEIEKDHTYCIDCITNFYRKH